jgi:hypothetical protein
MAVFLVLAAAPARMRVSASFKLAQRSRLHAVERRDAQQHVVAQALGEVLEDFAGLVELEVHQDGGDDLRMLVADQVGHGGRIHPLQALDAGRVVAGHDAADQAGGAVVAERLGQHGLDGFVVDRHRRALGGLLGEVVDHFFDALARHLLQRRHGVAELLHFLRPEVLQDLGSLVLPQRQQEDGGLFYAVTGRARRHLPIP